MGLRDRIEAALEAWGHLVYRRAWLTIGVMSLISLVLASQLVHLRLETSTESFLHEDDPVRRAYVDYRDQFGRDGMLMIGVLSDDALGRSSLEKLRAFHDELEAKVPYLEDITSLINVRSTRGEADELIVEDLMEDWPETEAELLALRQRVLASPFYRNSVISEDGRFSTVALETQLYSSRGASTSALDEFEAEGHVDDRLAYLTGEENAEVVAAVYDVIERYQADDFRLFAAGEPMLVEELQAAVRRDMSKFLLLSLVVITLLLWVLFRRLAGVALPLLTVVLALVATMGLMAWTRTPLSLPTQILPSFLLAVGIGAAVHVLAIFFQGMRQGRDKEDAVAFALGHSGLAIVMTSLTTAGGLLSFTAAEIAPIAHFGVYAPIGALMTLLYSIVMLPALISVTPLSRRDPAASQTARPLLDRVLLRFGAIATGFPRIVVGVWAVCVAVGLMGASKLVLSHNPLTWFPEDDEFRVATETIDREFQGTMSLEMLIRTGRENGLHDPELLRRLDQLRVYAETLEDERLKVGKTVSIADILKEIHQALNENQPAFYAIPDDRLLVAQELLLFENSGADDLENAVDSSFSTARFTLRVPWIDAAAYPPFVQMVEDHFNQVLDGHATVEATGMTAVISRTIHAVLTSLVRSYVIAFIVITPLMIFLLGSLRTGALSMVPNLAPVIITLGVMGWFDLPLDVFTLLIGCIAIGLAVDDTIHFMHNFQRYFSTSGDATWAVHETLNTTGRALLFTSLVLSAGFFIYMLSSMQNLFNFGLLVGFCIVVAFLADVLLAPALVVLVRGRGARAQSQSLANEGAL